MSAVVHFMRGLSMRFTMVALVLAFPAVVAAQDQGIRSSADRLVAEAVISADPADVARDQSAQRTPTPPLARSGVRRRPSMVGYIGDSTIGSELRIRFDAGFQLTAADRAEVFYAKCGCYKGLPASNPAYDPEAAGPGPGIAQSLDFRQLYLLGEYAVGDRASVYGELPIRWVLPQSFVPGSGSFPNSSGLSDVRGGVKLALASSEDHTVTVQLQADAPSGDSSKGLGTNHWSVTPTLLYFQRAGQRVAVESQLGYILPIGGSAGIPTSGSEKFAGRVAMYGVGLSVDLASSGDVRVAPVLELVGWHVLSGFQTATAGPADGINIVNVKLGLRVSSGDHSSVYFGYGRALTDAVWYDDIVRAEYRFGF
jgi:hypothetical protein